MPAGGGPNPVNSQIENVLKTSNNVSFIAQRTGMTQAQVAAYLTRRGYNVQGSGGQQFVMGAGPTLSAPKTATTGPSGGGTGSNNDLSTHPGKAADDVLPTAAAAPGQPPPPGFTSWQQYYDYLNSLGSAGASSAASSAAADLAEKRREFDLTYQRDVAKQNATEVDSLQKMLAGLSGPKDVYADLFFSHGLLPPRGYKPAPVPLTNAQKDAYAAMGVSPDQLQQMITGNGQPGADTGMLGSLGQSLQPQPGQPGFQQVQPNQIQQTGPANPTEQGGQLFGKAPAGTSVAGGPDVSANGGLTPPQVPAMAGGGQVPGQVGDPRLVVAHGGETVDNNTNQGQLAPMNNAGVHPAIQKLMDALSGLLSDPDFQQFAGVAGQAATTTKPAGKGKAVKAPAQQAPAPPVTPGGVQAMATGGTVTTPTATTPSTTSGGTATGGTSGTGLTSAQTLQYQQSGRNPLLNPAPPITPSPVPGGGAAAGAGAGTITSLPPGGFNPRSTPGGPRGIPSIMPTSGAPTSGAQGVVSMTGSQPKDNPIMPLDKMDPYTRALYDVHGRLHPYSAQQQMQMGPQGVDAVNSYIGRVLGGDVKAYTDLLDRLKPIGAPEASAASSGGGFKFG